jgi:hypothetical protein
MIVNDSGLAVYGDVDGHAYSLSATLGASTSLTLVAASDGNDSASVISRAGPTCGYGTGSDFFSDGGKFTMKITNMGNTCMATNPATAGPEFEITHN